MSVVLDILLQQTNKDYLETLKPTNSSEADELEDITEVKKSSDQRSLKRCALCKMMTEDIHKCWVRERIDVLTGQNLKLKQQLTTMWFQIQYYDKNTETISSLK